MSKSKLNIFPISSLSNSDVFLNLEKIWTEFNFCATWPNVQKENISEVSFGPDFAKIVWSNTEKEMRECDIVLLYAKPDDVLIGALVAAGMAFGLGKKLMIIGFHDSYAAWALHLNTYRATTLASARQMLNYLARMLNK